MSRTLKSVLALTNKDFSLNKVFAVRQCTTTATSSSSSSSSSFKAASDVPGLSKKTVDVASGEVGFPGASKKATYKNPEYFSYHNTSYFEAEVEMKKYRLPQPSNRSTK